MNWRSGQSSQKMRARERCTGSAVKVFLDLPDNDFDRGIRKACLSLVR